MNVAQSSMFNSRKQNTFPLASEREEISGFFPSDELELVGGSDIPQRQVDPITNSHKMHCRTKC